MPTKITKPAHKTKSRFQRTPSRSFSSSPTATNCPAWIDSFLLRFRDDLAKEGRLMWDPFASPQSAEEMEREEVRRQRLDRERRRMRMIFGEGGEEGVQVVEVDGAKAGRQELVEFELVVRLK